MREKSVVRLIRLTFLGLDISRTFDNMICQISEDTVKSQVKHDLQQIGLIHHNAGVRLDSNDWLHVKQWILVTLRNEQQEQHVPDPLEQKSDDCILLPQSLSLLQH